MQGWQYVIEVENFGICFLNLVVIRYILSIYNHKERLISNDYLNVWYLFIILRYNIRNNITGTRFFHKTADIQYKKENVC